MSVSMTTTSPSPFSSTVLTLVVCLERADDDENYIPQIFRVSVPHDTQPGAKLTDLQHAVIKLEELKVVDLCLLMNKRKSYKIAEYNTLANQCAKALDQLVSDEESDESYEDDDETSEEDFEEEKTPQKKQKVEPPPAAPYKIPSVYTLDADVFRKDMCRTFKTPPLQLSAFERHVTLMVTPDFEKAV